MYKWRGAIDDDFISRQLRKRIEEEAMLSDAKAMQQAESDRRTVQPGDRIPYERAYAYRQPIPKILDQVSRVRWLCSAMN